MSRKEVTSARSLSLSGYSSAAEPPSPGALVFRGTHTFFRGASCAYRYSVYVRIVMAQQLIGMNSFGYVRTAVPTSFLGLPDPIRKDPYASLFGVGRSHSRAARRSSTGALRHPRHFSKVRKAPSAPALRNSGRAEQFDLRVYEKATGKGPLSAYPAIKVIPSREGSGSVHLENPVYLQANSVVRPEGAGE